jgi:hypothetical protein
MPHAIRRVLEAAQVAITLVVLLAALSLIAWAAGIAALADLPYLLAGVFAGSFLMAVLRRDSRAPRRM